jgi:hypothetical protein
MEESNSLPDAEREGKPRFGPILRSKSYRWIFYTALILFGIVIVGGMIYQILYVLDKFPSSGDPGYEDFMKFRYIYPTLISVLNASSLILFGFGCFYAGIVDYTLPPNVRRGFIFAIVVFILAYEFFSFFGFFGFF